MKTYRGKVEVYIHSFLISTLDAVEWLIHDHFDLNPLKSAPASIE
jgi:hypothetical protein